MKIKQFNFNEKMLVKYLYEIGVDISGISIMKNKAETFKVGVNDIRIPAALILKQEMLSIGGDACLPKNFIVENDKNKTGNIVLLGTKKHFSDLINKLHYQQFGLNLLANKLKDLLFKKFNKLWKFKNKSIDCNTFKIMAIINVTPDSFYDGGKYNNNIDNVLNYTEKQINEGAHILDIGGESTRPGSDFISAKEEIKRVIPVLKEIKKRFPDIPISIDTTKEEVAYAALDNDADIINDISGLTFNEKIAEHISNFNAGFVLMHIKGKPKTMQKNIQYNNLIDDIINFFYKQLKLTEKYKIKPENIILDPGIGFGKTAEHNVEIIKRLKEFQCLSYPILIGLSNKSFFGKLLNLNIEERITATVSANLISYLNGATIFRVHNVKKNINALKTCDLFC